jgi:transcriptional regulator GlxA family with amidase domain
MLRLNFASRLCWTSPELSIADIAEACGLLDLSPDVLRAFRTTHGLAHAHAGE